MDCVSMLGHVTHLLMGTPAGDGAIQALAGKRHLRQFHTDTGLATLVGLDGLFGLSFFWHSPTFISAGLEPARASAQPWFLGMSG